MASGPRCEDAHIRLDPKESVEQEAMSSDLGESEGSPIMRVAALHYGLAWRSDQVKWAPEACSPIPMTLGRVVVAHAASFCRMPCLKSWIAKRQTASSGMGAMKFLSWKNAFQP